MPGRVGMAAAGSTAGRQRSRPKCDIVGAAMRPCCDSRIFHQTAQSATVANRVERPLQKPWSRWRGGLNEAFGEYPTLIHVVWRTGLRDQRGGPEQNL